MAKKANIEKDALVNGANVEEIAGAETLNGYEQEGETGKEGDDDDDYKEDAKVKTPKVAAPKASKDSKDYPKDAVLTQKPKGVRVHTLEPVDCYIASNRVAIAKDKDVEVSSDVAAILVNAKKAYRV